MAKRHFNWTIAIVFIIALIVLAVTAFSLREWQRNRMGNEAREAGLKAYEEQNWQDAAKNLGRYLSIDKTNVEVLLKYAEAQLNIRPLKSNNVKQAELTYRAVLRIDKNNPVAADKLVGLYLKMNAPAEAQLIAERYLQTNKAPNIRRMLAISMARQRNIKEAAKQLQTIIEEHPEEVEAYGTLGQLIISRPDDFSETAEHWFNEAVKNNPSSAQAFIARAAFYLTKSEVDKAISDLEIAEKLDLSDVSTHVRLATEFTKAGMFDKAKIHLEAVYAQEPANQELWQSWAMLAMRMMSKEEMLNVAQTGLKELESQPWGFMPIAAELFIRADEFEQGSQCLEKLKQEDIAPASTAFLEGLLADAKKQDQKAIQSWRRAEQLGDVSQKTRLSLASALFNAGDIQSAILQLRTLISERPLSFRGHFELAKLLIQTGSWDEAMEQARLAMEIAPDNVEAVLLYARTRMQFIENSPSGSKGQMWQDLEGKLVELENLISGAPEVKLLQLRLAISREQFAKAEKILADLQADDPSLIEVQMAEVGLLTAQKEFDSAISKLRVITEQFPEAVLPVRYLAVLLAEHRSKEDCEKVLTDALQRFEDPTIKRQLGMLLASFYDRWEQSEKSYQLLTRLSKELPEDIPIKCMLLKCKQVMANINTAQQIVDDIKAIEGETGWQWRCEQANIWLRSEDFRQRYPQIITMLKENLAADPADQTSRMLLAAAYEKAGEIQLAVAMYREALSRSPENIRIIVPTVTALYKAKEYEQADEILNHAIDQKLTHPGLAKLELRSYIRQGQLSSAEDILEDMIVEDPNDLNVPLSLALLKMRQNKCAQARQLLNKIKDKQPDSFPIIAALVELNIREKNKDEALALCEKVVKQFGNASAYVLRGKTYEMLGQSDLAKENFEQATAVEPENVRAWVFKSEYYWSIGQIEQAIEAIQKALALEPEDIYIQRRAVTFLLSSNEPEKADRGREILEEALSSNPQDIHLRLCKARSLFYKATAPATEQAERILQRLTEEQPKITDAWAMWTQIYLRQGQLGKAVDIVSRGLTYLPGNKTLLLLKAKAEAARAPALAIPTLKELVEIDPNDTDVIMNLVNMYVGAGQPEKAVQLLRDIKNTSEPDARRKIDIALAIALYESGNKADAEKQFDLLYQTYPDDPGVFLAEADLLKKGKKWTELMTKVTERFEKQPNDAITLVILANGLTRVKDKDALRMAEDILRMVLKSNPDSIEAMSVLAMILLADRPNDSAQLYERILKLKPDDVVSLNNLAWIMCEQQGKYRQALELTQRGLRKAPEHYVDLVDTRGVIYYRLGEHQKAVRDFEKSIELYPRNSSQLTASYFHLARALVALGRDDEVVSNLNKAIELNEEVGGLSQTDLAEAKRILGRLSEE